MGDGGCVRRGKCCWYYKQGIPFSTLIKRYYTVKLPFLHLVTHFVQKKNRQILVWKKKTKQLFACKSCNLKFVNLPSLDECPPSFRVPSFLLVIDYEREKESVNENF